MLGIPKRFRRCICRKTYELWQVTINVFRQLYQESWLSINATFLYMEGAQFESRLGQAIMRSIILFLTPSKDFPSHI